MKKDYIFAHHKSAPVLRFSTPSEFNDWLSRNFTDETSYWLQFAKKGGNGKTISYPQARDEALCYGWIDSVLNKYDDDYYLVRFSKRRKKSVWSQVNVGIVETLIAEGRMRDSGMKEVEAAKADGRWRNAYAPASSVQIPEDLLTALTQHNVLKNFEALTKTERYSIITRVAFTRTQKGREARIHKEVSKLISQNS